MNITIILPILLLICCIATVCLLLITITTPAIILQTEKPKPAYKALQKIGLDDIFKRDEKKKKEKCNWEGYYCVDGTLKRCTDGKMVEKVGCESNVCDPNDNTRCMPSVPEPAEDEEEEGAPVGTTGTGSGIPQGGTPGQGASCNWTGDRCWGGIIETCTSGVITNTTTCGYPNKCDPNDATRCLIPDPLCTVDGKICHQDNLWNCVNGQISKTQDCQHGCDVSTNQCKRAPDGYTIAFNNDGNLMYVYHYLKGTGLYGLKITRERRNATIFQVEPKSGDYNNYYTTINNEDYWLTSGAHRQISWAYLQKSLPRDSAWFIYNGNGALYHTGYSDNNPHYSQTKIQNATSLVVSGNPPLTENSIVSIRRPNLSDQEIRKYYSIKIEPYWEQSIPAGEGQYQQYQQAQTRIKDKLDELRVMFNKHKKLLD
jgi:hypothetical protein